MHTQQSAFVRVACTGAALLLGGGGAPSPKPDLS